MVRSAHYDNDDRGSRLQQRFQPRDLGTQILDLGRNMRRRQVTKLRRLLFQHPQATGFDVDQAPNMISAERGRARRAVVDMLVAHDLVTSYLVTREDVARIVDRVAGAEVHAAGLIRNWAMHIAANCDAHLRAAADRLGVAAACTWLRLTIHSDAL